MEEDNESGNLSIQETVHIYIRILTGTTVLLL